MSKPTKRRRCECTPNECDCDSPLLSVSKPKLPKVWVAQDDDGVVWAGRERDYGDSAGLTLHQYAPVQKPKRCEWSKLDPVFRGQSDRFSFSCSKDKFTWDPPSKFCPYCGGKIKVTK